MKKILVMTMTFIGLWSSAFAEEVVSHKSPKSFRIRAMHLTQPTTTCSVFDRGRGLSAHSSGVRKALSDRRSLQGILVFASLAQRVPVSLLWWQDSLEDVQRTTVLQNLPLSGLRYGRDNFPGFASAADTLVPSHVVRHEPEERRQCARVAAGLGSWQLQNGLGHAA